MRTQTAKIGLTQVAAARRDVMRAIVQDVYGSADQLRLAEVDQPVIAADEVLVQVHAAGVDRGTCHLMRGEPYLVRILGFGFRGPKNRVPGLDVAGTVVAVSGLAALQALRAGRIAARQKVLIIGASGGVGSYAVQLAKAFGATV